MPNELIKNGAQPGNKQGRYTPIWVGSMRSGLVTNRSPLIGSTAPRLMEKFYGTSGDLMIDGSNVEISSRFTMVRRPGNSVYNGGTFSGVNAFYEFRLQNGTIKVIADSLTQVTDITGSNNTAVLTKNASAGQTYFQSVLNTLFMGDGAEQKKWAWNTNTWAGATSYSPALMYSIGNTVVPGYTLIDANGNLQVLTTAGTSGALQPTWATTYGATTTDGTAVWTCYGSPLQNWGIVAPSTAASPVNASLPNPPNPLWAANTFYAPTTVQVVDTNNNIQTLTTAGTTGGVQPTWNVTLGGTTTDNTAVWTNKGTANWQAGHAYAVGDIVAVSYTVNDVEIPTFDDTLLTRNGVPPRVRSYKAFSVTYNDCFIVTKAGTSAGTQPVWRPGFGSLANDNTVTWKNIGTKITWASIGAATVVSTAITIQDSNGNIQMPTLPGKTGATAPTWSTTQGALTTDNTQKWSNMGPIAAGSTGAAATGTWLYGYAYKNSVANTVSSMSVLSAPVLLAANSYMLVQGDGCPDQQCDTIIMFRTTQGGGDLWWLAEFANPGANKTWTFNDTYPDSALNEFIAAPENGVNDPPPAGLIHLTYHLNRVWGNVGNIVYYSNPLTTVLGSGTEQFPRSNNYFVFPSVVTRLEPVSSGLMVFTTSDVYMISGQGTPSSILYAYPLIPGLGLLSYNCLTKLGGTFYLFTSAKKLVALDPSAGFQEPGQPIGDRLINLSPSTAYLTWHDGGATDTALFLADGSTGWYRMSMNFNSSVESPVVWSPLATIAGGVKAVQSVETSPGTKQLLLGPATTGPILKRNLQVWTDNGAPYTANATIGSIVLAEPGQMAQVAFLAADSVAVQNSTRAAVAVVFDEALPYYTGTFATLSNVQNDPPRLAPSTSLYSHRYYTNQLQLPTWCRHMQVRISWPAENFQNELLSLTIFGAVWIEK